MCHLSLIPLLFPLLWNGTNVFWKSNGFHSILRWFEYSMCIGTFMPSLHWSPCLHVFFRSFFAPIIQPPFPWGDIYRWFKRFSKFIHDLELTVNTMIKIVIQMQKPTKVEWKKTLNTKRLIPNLRSHWSHWWISTVIDASKVSRDIIKRVNMKKWFMFKSTCTSVCWPCANMHLNKLELKSKAVGWESKPNGICTKSAIEMLGSKILLLIIRIPPFVPKFYLIIIHKDHKQNDLEIEY